MKAIETVYNGYKFRSRLEARWAVFLDALGWTWEYEKEGFELDNGVKYLPDFYIPAIKTWIEIKPDKFSVEEIEKCRQLSIGLNDDHFVMMASGLPEQISYDSFCNKGQPTDITITSYIRSKGWDMPYLGNYWDDFDSHAFDLAKSARFEFGQSGATI